MMQPKNSTQIGAQILDFRTSLLRFLIVLSIILLFVKIFIPPGHVQSFSGSLFGWLVLAIFVIMPLSPIISIIKTIGYILTGRLHFPKNRVGETVVDEQGKKFTVFRQVVVNSMKGQAIQPGVLLTLHFKVTNMSPKVNQFYSLLPLPLYIGDHGFRSKLFTIQGEDCQSIYEWDTVQDAENYIQSIALKSILLRSVPGSFSYKIQPMHD
ncbi:MAG: hypothetical protein ABSA51_03600 [Anaerolineaceae bacterium]|jgi:hypothetical protein